MTIHASAAVHAGHHRPTNEDRVLADSALGLAVVADGVGGELGGELAAEAAISAIATSVGAGGDLAIAAAAADVAVRACRGASTTFAAVRIAGAIAELSHCGDVRVYVLRRPSAPALEPGAPRYCPAVRLHSGATLVCPTRDHTSVCELVERGHLDRGAAARHPLRHAISRALGKDDARCDLARIALVAGDRIIVCSDGLWSLVDDVTIAQIVEGSATVDAATTLLLAAALDAGGTDNIGITVVFWEVV